METTEQRIEAWCQWFDVEPPEIEYDEEDGLAGGPVLTDSLMKWCDDNHVNLDWVFCGDDRALAIAYHRQEEKFRPLRKLIDTMDSAEQGILMKYLRKQGSGEITFDDAMKGMPAEIEEYRG